MHGALHLGVSLGEAEDVVHEEKHVLQSIACKGINLVRSGARQLVHLALVVAEVLSDSQTGESDTSTSSRGLVHLAVHQCSLGLVGAELSKGCMSESNVRIAECTRAP